MRSGGFQRKRACALGAGLLLLCVAAGLPGCASRHAGLALAPGATDPEVRSLARLAEGGDKYAQLELGIRYEEGRGLPMDLGLAETLYRRAASPGRRAEWIYSPPAGAAIKGRVVQLDRSSGSPGLPAARERLARLRERQKAMKP